MARGTSQTTENVYLFVKAYIKEHTYPPSLREIGKGCHLAVTSVTKHLDRLEWEGKIRRDEGHARGITLVNDDDA